MIKKDEIFLVVTEDGNIIYDITEEEIQARDQIIYESDIEDLVETELQESIHEIDKEEFENEVDFFLQDAIREDYTNYYIDTHLDTVSLTEEAKYIIQEEVIERIKDRLK